MSALASDGVKVATELISDGCSDSTADTKWTIADPASSSNLCLIGTFAEVVIMADVRNVSSLPAVRYASSHEQSFTYNVRLPIASENIAFVRSKPVISANNSLRLQNHITSPRLMRRFDPISRAIMRKLLKPKMRKQLAHNPIAR